jgi:hypothetical protein
MAGIENLQRTTRDSRSNWKPFKIGTSFSRNRFSSLTHFKEQKLLPGPSMSETMLTYSEGCRRGAYGSTERSTVPGTITELSIR